MLRVAGLLSCAFVLACSSSSPTTQALSQSSTAATPVITLGVLTVRFQDMPIARMYADGRTESVGANAPGKDAIFTPGPVFHADGTIDLTKGGFKARVEADGDIFAVPPPGSGHTEQRFGRIAGDQILVGDSGSSGIRLEADSLIMFSGSTTTNVIGVVDPRRLGRTALLMAAAFTLDAAITGN